MGKKPAKAMAAPPSKQELAKAQESDIGVLQERGRRLINFIVLMRGPLAQDAAAHVRAAIDMTAANIIARNEEQNDDLV